MAVEDDYRVGMIEDYVQDKTEVCIMELWKYALCNEFTKPSRRESNDLSLILQSLGGWRRGKVKHHPAFGNQLFWENYEAVFPPLGDDNLP